MVRARQVDVALIPQKLPNKNDNDLGGASPIGFLPFGTDKSSDSRREIIVSDELPVTKWIGAVKKGDAPTAEQGIWEAYFVRLQALASAKLANYEDGEDVALSAMKSFFRRAQAGQFPKLQDRTELWPLLVQTTIWKANKPSTLELCKET